VIDLTGDVDRLPVKRKLTFTNTCVCRTGETCALCVSSEGEDELVSYEKSEGEMEFEEEQQRQVELERELKTLPRDPVTGGRMIPDQSYESDISSEAEDEHIAEELSFFEEQRAKALKKLEIPLTQIVADEDEVQSEARFIRELKAAAEEYCPNCGQNMETHYAQCSPPPSPVAIGPTATVFENFVRFQARLLAEFNAYPDLNLLEAMNIVLDDYKK